MSIFEIIMLICFGAAWPFSIYKSYTARSNKGKSVFFTAIIFAGYISGILHKTYYYPDKVRYLYMLNAIMVFIDMMLFVRNKKLDASRGM